MRDRLYITKADYEKLQRLIEGMRTTGSFDMKYLNMLAEELDHAEVVEPEAVPPNVVTMNSEVRLKDLDSGQSIVYRLVFPAQARRENSISVLAPIGMAMLGYQVGDIIEWPVPRGIRRLKVLEVLFQPEAAGVSGG
ncbi:MAG: nucleoside diphosphate kinase regulator [Bryobacterales bacterium]|nr:nucleoside diphosphate kinase regulator [Bryobacterales bacterium]